MATCVNNKIDSNITGLRIAEEECLGLLPVNPVWVPEEPNSYTDFGPEVTTVARNPINPGRQRKKGVVTDLDASGGLNKDLTQTNTQDLLQGFLFADIRAKGFSRLYAPRTTLAFTGTATTDNLTATNHGMFTGYGPIQATGGSLPTGMAENTNYWVIAVDANNFKIATSKANAIAGTAIDLTANGSGSVASVMGAVATGVTVNDPTGFAIGDKVFISGFANQANNGLKTLTGITGATLEFTGAVAEQSRYGVTVASVGINADAADLEVDASGPLPLLTSTTLDFTTLGFTPGEWIFIGGDLAANQFAEAANNGFKRIRAIAANALTLDKSDDPMVTDDGAGKSVSLFWGRFLKNEIGGLIKRRTYQLERTLGSIDGLEPPQSEYLVGAVPSEATFNLATADKVTVDMSFIATDGEQRTQVEGLKPGSRPTLPESDAFNTSSDVKRIRMALAGSTDEAPIPLFAFVTDLSLTINNTLTANKAIGKLGAIDITAGTFAVSASTTAYFSDISAVKAVRDNADVTLDVIFVKANAGIVADLPLVALGDGRATVELDQPIMLPLSADAATAAKIDPNLDYTLGFTFFDYLPNLAAV